MNPTASLISNRQLRSAAESAASFTRAASKTQGAASAAAAILTAGLIGLPVFLSLKGAQR